jgi:hypothetical protein
MVIHLVVSTWEQGWRNWSWKGGVWCDWTLVSGGPDPAVVSSVTLTEKAWPRVHDRTLVEEHDRTRWCGRARDRTLPWWVRSVFGANGHNLNVGAGVCDRWKSTFGIWRRWHMAWIRGSDAGCSTSGHRDRRIRSLRREPNDEPNGSIFGGAL